MLIHTDYLQIEPSRGNTEIVVVFTDHFLWYVQAHVNKLETAAGTANLLWENFIVHYDFPEKIIDTQ